MGVWTMNVYGTYVEDSFEWVLTLMIPLWLSTYFEDSFVIEYLLWGFLWDWVLTLRIPLWLSTYFEDAFVIEKQVGCFEISMYNPVVMEMRHTF